MKARWPREATLKTVWEGCYFDGCSATRHEVTITVMGSGLQIQKQDGSTIWWSYEEVRQTQGSNAGEPVRLEKGGELPEALVVPDSTFLIALLQASRQTQGRFSLPLRPFLRLKLTLAAAAAAVMVGAVLYVWAIPALADLVAARVPASWEEQLGNKVVEGLAPPQMRCTEANRMQVLEKIVSTLAAAVPQSPYKFRPIVVNAPTINAVAAPGGQIVVFRGLLDKTKSPEELAGVMAHEIEHVLHRHGTKAVFREMSLRILVAILAGDSTGLGSVMEAAGTLGGLRYRRGDEAEADREGMKLVQAARLNPMGMIYFLDTLKQEQPETSRPIAYLSTHPPTQNRIEQLKKIADQAHYSPVPLLAGYPWGDIGKVCEQGK